MFVTCGDHRRISPITESWSGRLVIMWSRIVSRSFDRDPTVVLGAARAASNRTGHLWLAFAGIERQHFPWHARNTCAASRRSRGDETGRWLAGAVGDLCGQCGDRLTRVRWGGQAWAGLPLVVTGSSWPVRGRMQVWCWSPMPGTPRCCCVRVCQSPVLIWAPAGGSPFPVVSE